MTISFYEKLDNELANYGWLFDLIFKMRTMGYIQELVRLIF
jgi:hypothetical protein